MAIDLPSAPQANHRVAGSHGQTNKPGDTSQTDGAVGFAALISMLSDPGLDSSNTGDGTGSVLSPVSSDGSSAVQDINVALASGQLRDSAVFTLPGVAQPLSASAVEVEDKGLNPAGRRSATTGFQAVKAQVKTAASGFRQSVIDSDSSVGVAGAHREFGGAPRGVSQQGGRAVTANTVTSQAIPVGALKAASSTGSRLNSELLVAAAEAVPVAALGQGSSPKVGPSTGHLKVISEKTLPPVPTVLMDAKPTVFSSEKGLVSSKQLAQLMGNQTDISVESDSPLPAVSADAELPVSTTAEGQSQPTQLVHSAGGHTDVSVQPGMSMPAESLNPPLLSATPIRAESAPAVAPLAAVDLSKVANKAALVAPDSSARVPGQENGQTLVPSPVVIPVAELVPKPGGAFASQQVSVERQLRQDTTDKTSGFSAASGMGNASLPNPALVINPQDAGVRMPERPAKHGSSRFGTGGEGVYGQPLTTFNSADAQFQVLPTSSAAASTSVAETVSHWAAQGVHSASMQLDGFGDEPVEVRISVNGDMAQVDFRTNQPEVRLAIEGAASQLKDLLSGQGMQLAGMSIGTSSRGAPQDKYPRQTSDSRKVTVAKSDAVDTVRAKSPNSSVGQSLDLFV